MSNPDQLTEAEAKFFETGELSPELAAENNVELPTEQPSEQAPQQVAVAPPAQPRPAEAPGAAVPPPSTSTPPVQPDFYATLQRQLAEAEGRRLAAEQRLNDLVTQLQSATATPPPDPEADPFGHVQHQVNNIAATLQSLQTNMQQQEQVTNLNAYLTGFVNQVREMRDAFSATTPDFKDAYAHVRAMRTNDLRDAGVPEAALPAALLQDEMTLAQNALASGRNPAAVLYDMAKRHGYAPKAPPPPPPATRIAQLQAGAAAAVSVPRAAAEVVLSPEGLREASDSDLDKLVQSDDMWAKVVGGGTHANDIF